MYLYIYDEFVQERRYEREIAEIENRLTDLGITGKIIRFALFRNAGEQIRDEARRGATTVVAVGDDRTVAKILDAVVETGLPLGVIAIGARQTIANFLGIPGGSAGCDVLSARIIHEVDVGCLNGKRFISCLRLLTPNVSLLCDDRYRVSLIESGRIEIQNFDDEKMANPQDGRLDAVIYSKPRTGWFRYFGGSDGMTHLPIRSATIESAAASTPLRLICDGQEIEGDAFTIALDNLQLRVITGRERRF